jgi:oligopeptide/dipeptide ABC transporter ATP-binding protein
MNRLELRDLVVSYGSGKRGVVACDGVSLTLGSGRTLGLVGESGCGKSSIARALVGLVPVASGQILLDGSDCTPMRSRNAVDYRRRVQMVFQDPYSSLNPRMTIDRAIGEAITLRGVGARSERRQAVLRALELVGLGESALKRYPHEFSGGQRQRIAIARALAVGPEVLIADEVTSSLDVSVQATILSLLKNIQSETGVSLLFISHDLSVVRHMSDRVAVMYLGQVVETAATDELFARPRHPYTQALLKSIPRLGEAREGSPVSGDLPDPHAPPPGCRFHTRCPVGPIHFPDRVICTNVDPHATAGEREHAASCHFAPAASPAADQEPVAPRA